MKINLLSVSVLLQLLLFPAGGSVCLAAMEKTPDEPGISFVADRDVPRISVDELKTRLNDPSLIIIDVRTSKDWQASSTKIKGAFREVPEKVEEWALKYDKDKSFVLYCT